MKIRSTHILLMLAILLPSCDSFLEIQPKGKIIPETLADFRALLTTGYETVPQDRSMSALRGDELTLNLNWEGIYNSELRDIYFWNDVAPDPNTLPFPWQNFYKSIFYANHVIEEGGNASEGKEDEIKQLVGEAYLLRAYMHFNLVNLYANHYGKQDPASQKGIPLYLDIDIEQDFHPNSVKQVYDQILSDINAGLKLMSANEQPKGYNYRFSKVSAFALLAKVHLYMNQWGKAAEAAGDALKINSQLEDLNKKSSSDLPYFNFQSAENILALEQTFSFTISSETCASNKLIAAYNQTGDLRFNLYFSEGYDGYTIQVGDKQQNKVSFRTAELYLIEAEALAHDGQPEKAKNSLLKLLQNRLTPDYFTTVKNAVELLDNTALVDYILEERFRELACQGSRWFDLRRTTQPELNKTANGETIVLNSGDSRYTLRFPKEALENNPNLIDK